MKKTLKAGAVMALIAALAVPATAYADNGYENHGPGIALEQQGQELQAQ